MSTRSASHEVPLDGSFRMAKDVKIPAIAVTYEMAHTLGLTDLCDGWGLVHLLFLVAKGQEFTVATLLESLRSAGIKAANGSGLIGLDQVRKTVKNFIRVGLVRPVEQSHGERGRFGAQVYEIYLDPADNPDWAAYPGAGPASPPPVAEAKAAAAAAVAPPATAARAEVEAAPVPQVSAPVTEQEVAAAFDLLLNLPPVWKVGPKSATELAPTLARNAKLQGWLLDGDLVAQLGLPGDVRSPKGILRYRVEDLPRRNPLYAGQSNRPEPARVDQQRPLSPCPRHPEVDAARCEPCNAREAAAEAAREARAGAAAGRPPAPRSPVESAPQAPDVAAALARHGQRALLGRGGS